MYYISKSLSRGKFVEKQINFCRIYEKTPMKLDRNAKNLYNSSVNVGQ